MKNANYLLTGLTLPNGSKSDITISDGVITEIASNIIAAPGFTKVDLAGSIALPGLVDLHTHLREPGKEDAETVLSGTMAAAKGGFVAVSAMANTSPVADTAGVVEQVFALGQSAGFVDVFPIGAVTQGIEGKVLAEIYATELVNKGRGNGDVLNGIALNGPRMYVTGKNWNTLFVMLIWIIWEEKISV